MKFDDDRCSAAASSYRTQYSAVGFDEQSRDRQPKSELSTWTHHERPREIAQRFSRETFAVVAHRDPKLPRAYADADLNPTGRVARGVVNEIDEHLQHPLAVDRRDRAAVLREVQAPLRISRFDGTPRSLNDGADIRGRDAQAQTVVHSDLYYLLATSTADTRWPMGACGLTPGYTGHAFWDSDTWIFPALLLLHPERAKSLAMFRAYTLPAAQARAQARGFNGAMYPWEADPENGSEQIPFFAHVLSEREIHVNADVAIAQWQYWLATHDREWLKHNGWPVIRNVADFWASRASWSSRSRTCSRTRGSTRGERRAWFAWRAPARS